MIPSRNKYKTNASRGLLGAVAIALTAMAGCAGNQGLVYNKNFTPAYSPSSLSGLRKPLLVETFGTPAAGQSQEQVTAATVNGLEERGPRWARLKYSGNPEDSPNPPYRLRFAYGAAKGFSRDRFCLEDLQVSEVGSDGESKRTVVALCANGRWLSIAEGSPGAQADVDSPEFTSFVGLISRQVMPRNNPVLVRECIFRRCD